MSEEDMTVTAGGGAQTLLMESDFTAFRSASTNEESSDESDNIDSDVEGAIYAQLYFQDGTPSVGQKECPVHTDTSSGGISVTVIPTPQRAAAAIEATRSGEARKHPRKKSSGHRSKKPRLETAVTEQEEEWRAKPAQSLSQDILSSPLKGAEDSRCLSVQTKPSPYGKVAHRVTTPRRDAEGMCEWFEARWSGNSSDEEDDRVGRQPCPGEWKAGDEDFAARGPEKALGELGQGLGSEDCVVVEVESPCGPQRTSRKRKSSTEGPGAHVQVYHAGPMVDLKKEKAESDDDGDNSLCNSSNEGEDDGEDDQAAASSAGIDASDSLSDDDIVSVDGGEDEDLEVGLVRIEELQTCVTSEDKWCINEKDQLGRAAYDKRHGTGRYFYGTKLCGNCKQRDHDTFECAQPKRNKVCYLCSGLQHLSSRCPVDLCQYCLQIRHRGRSCRASWASPSTCCNRCYMNGHIANVCPELWRQFHNTSGLGSLTVIKPKEQRQTKRVFCYNCGESGHFGHECSQKRPQGYPLPFTPVIAHYDKDPPRGKIVVTRDSPPPTQGPKQETERREDRKATPKKKKKVKEEKKRRTEASSDDTSKRRVRFERDSFSHKRRRPTTKLYSPPPRTKKVEPADFSRPMVPSGSRNADLMEPVSVSITFPADSRESFKRRVSLPAMTPESSRQQWNPRVTAPIENHSAPIEPFPPRGASSYRERSLSVSTSRDLRRQSAIESDDYPRVPFVLPATGRDQSSGERPYYADMPCTEWRSQPMGHTPAQDGLPFRRRSGYDANPGATPFGVQRAISAPQTGDGGGGGGPVFSAVGGQYYSNRGFRGSEAVVRKITLLKPDLKSRRRPHQN